MPLAPGISVALFGTRVVVLDAIADRYRLVVGRKSGALTLLGAGQEVEDVAALEALLLDGILTMPIDGPILLACPATPMRSAVEMPLRTGPDVSAIETAIALGTVIVRQRLASFARILRWAQGLQDGRSTLFTFDAAAFGQSYDRVRNLIPFERICLRDSLALFALLRRRGVRCNLVFGVKLDPFGAHCWVQADDIVLSDTLWSARPMQPILIV